MFAACEVPKDKADLLVLNANVYSVDDSFSRSATFAVHDGIFVAAGSSEDLKSKFDATQILDAGGSAFKGYP
ncbi:MAG: hypothetical protein WBM85_04505 [Eudoraea sp.]